MEALTYEISAHFIECIACKMAVGGATFGLHQAEMYGGEEAELCHLAPDERYPDSNNNLFTFTFPSKDVMFPCYFT